MAIPKNKSGRPKSKKFDPILTIELEESIKKTKRRVQAKNLIGVELASTFSCSGCRYLQPGRICNRFSVGGEIEVSPTGKCLNKY